MDLDIHVTEVDDDGNELEEERRRRRRTTRTTRRRSRRRRRIDQFAYQHNICSYPRNLTMNNHWT